jgi:hypothetical protein
MKIREIKYIYKKKPPKKGINKKKRIYLFIYIFAKKVNKAQEENPPKKTK